MAECINKNCENGYIFDTLYGCTECDRGKKIQHVDDVRKLKSNQAENKRLRRRIKEYIAN